MQIPTFPLLIYFSLVNGDTVLQSPTITSWGDWGAIEKCPNQTFVTGMQIKVENSQPLFHDDTGLNAIRLFCSDLSGADEQKRTTIQSTVGSFGTWRSKFFCTGGLAVGFQLRSEGEQGRGNKHDDTAANNFRLMCSDGQTLEGEGTAWGDWTAVQMCRKRQALCSIETQVELPQGIHDDTSLNNVRLHCCNVPNPAANCIPTDFWELVAECDNTNAFTPTTCTYERRIGLGYSSWQSSPSSNVHEKTLFEHLGFSIGLEAQILSKKFQFETGVAGKTGYNWGSSKTDTWNQETITRVSFDVPPGVRSSMVQVVGACGNYLVRTAKFQRIDMIGASPGLLGMTSFTTIPAPSTIFESNKINMPEY